MCSEQARMEQLPVPHDHECPDCGKKFSCHGTCPVLDGFDPLDEPFCNPCWEAIRDSEVPKS